MTRSGRKRRQWMSLALDIVCHRILTFSLRRQRRRARLQKVSAMGKIGFRHSASGRPSMNDPKDSQPRPLMRHINGLSRVSCKTATRYDGPHDDRTWNLFQLTEKWMGLSWTDGTRSVKVVEHGRSGRRPCSTEIRSTQFHTTSPNDHLDGEVVLHSCFAAAVCGDRIMPWLRKLHAVQCTAMAEQSLQEGK